MLDRPKTMQEQLNVLPLCEFPTSLPFSFGSCTRQDQVAFVLKLSVLSEFLCNHAPKSC